MYKWFCPQACAEKAFFTYVIIIFIMSVLFNTVNEQTMRSNIEEQVAGRNDGALKKHAAGGDSALSATAPG
jgi:hypothetical protein